MRYHIDDEIVVDVDYDWKYGEPSIYNDEKIYYLTKELNGKDNDEDWLEELILDYTNKTYDELVEFIKINGKQKYKIQALPVIIQIIG